MAFTKRKYTTYEAYKLLLDGTKVLSRIEHNGVRVDVKKLDKTILRIERKIAKMENRLTKSKVYKLWTKHFGVKANIGSHTQLATILFDVMGYETTAVTKTGKVKTDKKVLEKIDHPFVRKWTEVQSWKKALSTYLVGIKKDIIQNKYDGYYYVHPFYNLNVASTYRSTSNDPNFQNFPVRNWVIAEGIRDIYVPRPGNHIVENDLAQIEVRVAASYTNDPVLVKYIKDKSTDMHRDMAAEIFMLRPDQVAKNPRYCAKNQFVFPEFYGSVFFQQQVAGELWESMSRLDGMRVKKKTDDAKNPTGRKLRSHLKRKGIRSLGMLNDPQSPTVPGTFVHHLKGIEDGFWNKRFTTYRDWKISWHNKYKKTASYKNKLGFQLLGDYSKNDVVNHPIQGPAFLIALWIMIELQKELDKRGMKTLLIGEIHDCIIADVPPDELQLYLDLVKEITEVRLPKDPMWGWLTVPIEIEAEVTPVDGSWAQKAEWVKKEGRWAKKG